jgi:hypothetical protein
MERQMDVTITIWDAAGNVVVHETAPAQTATQEEIDEMVILIESGCPAWLASQIVALSQS